MATESSARIGKAFFRKIALFGLLLRACREVKCSEDFTCPLPVPPEKQNGWPFMTAPQSRPMYLALRNFETETSKKHPTTCVFALTTVREARIRQVTQKYYFLPAESTQWYTFNKYFVAISEPSSPDIYQLFQSAHGGDAINYTVLYTTQNCLLAKLPDGKHNVPKPCELFVRKQYFNGVQDCCKSYFEQLCGKPNKEISNGPECNGKPKSGAISVDPSWIDLYS